MKIKQNTNNELPTTTTNTLHSSQRTIDTPHVAEGSGKPLRHNQWIPSRRSSLAGISLASVATVDRGPLTKIIKWQHPLVTVPPPLVESGEPSMIFLFFDCASRVIATFNLLSFNYDYLLVRCLLLRLLLTANVFSFVSAVVFPLVRSFSRFTMKLSVRGVFLAVLVGLLMPLVDFNGRNPVSLEEVSQPHCTIVVVRSSCC